MIDYILQVKGQDMLQVVYSSGANRFIYPDATGTYGANMTKSQIDFMGNSFMVEYNRPCDKSIYYYLSKTNPNGQILKMIDG